MDVDSGISRKLPLMLEENIETPEIHKRNIFVVFIKNNKILSGIGSPTNMVEINGDESISSSLKDDVKKFITNNGKKENSSESPEKSCCFFKNSRRNLLQNLYSSSK